MFDIPRLECDEDDFVLTDICYSLALCLHTEEECGPHSCQSGTKVQISPSRVTQHMDLFSMF